MPVTIGATGEKPPFGVREGRVHPASGEDVAARSPSPLSPEKELRPRDLALGELRVSLAAQPSALAQRHLHERSEAAAGTAHSTEVVGGSTDEHAHEELRWQRVEGLEHRERRGRKLSSEFRVSGLGRSTHGVLLEVHVVALEVHPPNSTRAGWCGGAGQAVRTALSLSFFSAVPPTLSAQRDGAYRRLYTRAVLQPCPSLAREARAATAALEARKFTYSMLEQSLSRYFPPLRTFPSGVPRLTAGCSLSESLGVPPSKAGGKPQKGRAPLLTVSAPPRPFRLAWRAA